jgi:ABC-type transport system involved in cytochrome c biogenesis permease subunit
MDSLISWTTNALNTSSFIYLAACFGYIWSVSKTDPERVKVWARRSMYLVWVGFVLHTLGLLGRWYIGGFDRPPWTNLYESLVAFAWGLVAVQIWADKKWKFPLLGLVASPLVFILMGMSVMTANKSIEPLIPALQSYWLQIHVLFGIVAYAAFSGAACIAFLYLMRRGVSLSKIGAGLALILLVNLSIAGGKEAFSTGYFYMARTATRSLPNGKVVQTKDTYREYEGGPVITRMERVPYAHVPFWLAWLLFAASIITFFKVRKKENDLMPDEGEELSADSAARKGNDLLPLARGVYIAALASFALFFVNIAWAKNLSPTLSMASNPYLVMLLLMSFFLGMVFLIVQFRYKTFLTSLPSAGRLDELGYKNILFGFPFQTLLLITGAVWAYSAWGRSWGWDPKETWALITWFAYLIYLHGRLLLRWKGPLLSVISIISFVILIFAFLGVNLVLSGLHSYGAA